MARTATLGRLTWRRATLTAIHRETDTARTLALSIPDWPGHQPGQHLELRLTSRDGYSAQRPYSIASAPGGSTVTLTVETTPGGEVSPFLTRMAHSGTLVEVRGPLGGWFVWTPEVTRPVQLVGGGSGVVPLMSMLRTHRSISHPCPMRLLYSVRDPAALLYPSELGEASRAPAGAAPDDSGVTVLYSRRAPSDDPRGAGRIVGHDLAAHALPAATNPLCFVCGPTSFVETAIDLLQAAGHAADAIRAERFGQGRGDR